jgi:hypothetical protein
VPKAMTPRREWRAVHPRQPVLLTDDERHARQVASTWLREADAMKPGAFAEWVKNGISLSSRVVGKWERHDV